MKFVCDKCSTRYSIAEERVRGKILKIRCKNCGNVVTVREGMDVDPVNRTGKATMAVPLISPSALAAAASGPAAAPAALQEEWYVSIDGVQTGPLSLPDAQKWVSSKPFGAELHCWNEGFDDWLPVEKVSHFRNLRKPPMRQRAKTAPPPVPEKPLFAATMASLEKGANGAGGAAAKSAVPAVGKPLPPVRPSSPALPRPATPALPKASAPALPRSATPAPAAAAAAAAANAAKQSPTPIRGSSSSVLTARPAGASSTANRIISSVGSKGPASSGAAALADAFGADEASDALTAVGAPMFGDDAPAASAPAAAARPPVDIKSMREALEDEDDGLSIGEVSRVVKLTDLAPRPKTKSIGGGTGSVQRIAATSASASLTGTQQKLSPSELGMNVDPALAAAAPGEAGPDDSVVAASIAQKHRRGMVALIAFSALLVAGLIGVVAWKVSQNPDEIGGGLGGTKQIDTSRPEDIIRRQQQQPIPDTGSGSATHVTQGTHHPRNPFNTSNGTQGHDDPGEDSLQAGEVEDMAAKQNEGTMRCYMRAQKGAMGFEIADIKKISVTLGVNKDGAVTDVQLSSHGNDSFGQCLIARIKAWRFRASPSGGTFRISLAFGN